MEASGSVPQTVGMLAVDTVRFVAEAGYPCGPCDPVSESVNKGSKGRRKVRNKYHWK